MRLRLVSLFGATAVIAALAAQGPPTASAQICGSQAEMTVGKVVVNPAGDPDAARQFTFTPNPTAPWLLASEQTQGFFQLVHDGTRTRCTDSTSQDYTVTESTDPLYNTTSSCIGDLPSPPGEPSRTSSASGSSVTFRPGPTQGEILQCTFTNTRKTGSLRVEKALVPSSDPGKFDLQIDGVTRIANAGHGQGVTSTVETGNHSVGELAGTGTSLGDYASAIECRNAQGGLVKSGAGTSLSDIAVGEGELITCTFTNTFTGTPANRPPSCAGVTASPSNVAATRRDQMKLITLSGATDPDGDPLGFHIDAVSQDEQVSGVFPDAQLTTAGADSNQVGVRAERDNAGNGRVYRIAFTVTDGRGGSCARTAGVGGDTGAKVAVPRKKGQLAVDDGDTNSWNSFTGGPVLGTLP